MKADEWKYQTVLIVKFRCKICKTIHNIKFDDIDREHLNTENITVECIKCRYKNKVSR